MLVTKNQYILLTHMLQFSAKTTHFRNIMQHLQNLKTYGYAIRPDGNSALSLLSICTIFSAQGNWQLRYGSGIPFC